MLREDELFVTEALCAEFSCTWRAGEDPPDVYLSLGNIDVAVEISTLTQHVINDSGEATPRLSQDAGVVRLCNELNEELGKYIPDQLYVIVTLLAPIKIIRNFKDKLRQEILDKVNDCAPGNWETSIQENLVKIHVVHGKRQSGKKVIGIVGNKHSTANIAENAKFILSQRIEEKIKKCAHIKHRPLWLALFNDYWLADFQSYQSAEIFSATEHFFEKILLIDGGKNVHQINNGQPK